MRIRDYAAGYLAGMLVRRLSQLLPQLEPESRARIEQTVLEALPAGAKALRTELETCRAALNRTRLEADQALREAAGLRAELRRLAAREHAP